jgi:ABC-type branched-subunit amino acid transport system permease subunit
MMIFCSGVNTLFPPLGAAAVVAAATEAIREAVLAALNDVTAVPTATRVVGKPVGRIRDDAVSVAMLAVLTAVRMPGADISAVEVEDV